MNFQDFSISKMRFFMFLRSILSTFSNLEGYVSVCFLLLCVYISLPSDARETKGNKKNYLVGSIVQNPVSAAAGPSEPRG